jgi:hypothetical protein
MVPPDAPQATTPTSGFELPPWLRDRMVPVADAHPMAEPHPSGARGRKGLDGYLPGLTVAAIVGGLIIGVGLFNFLGTHPDLVANTDRTTIAVTRAVAAIAVVAAFLGVFNFIVSNGFSDVRGQSLPLRICYWLVAGFGALALCITVIPLLIAIVVAVLAGIAAFFGLIAYSDPEAEIAAKRRRNLL